MHVVPDVRPRVPAARRRSERDVAAKPLRLSQIPGLPEVHHWCLPNGLRVVVIPQPHLHTASVAVFVKAGSRYETRGTNGLSHFLEHMLFRGTARYPSSYALNLAIEQLGGTLGGTTHADFTAYEVSLPPESVLQGAAIVADMLSDPIFGEMAVEKRIVREEILESLDEEGRDICIENVSRKLVYGAHPLGLTITGSPCDVDAFTHEDLRGHMRRFYGARNMVFCVSGAVQVAEVFDAAARHLGGLPPGSQARAKRPLSRQRRPRWRYVESHGSQTDVRVSFQSFGERDPRQLAQQLLCRVLDDGMSTRLHRRICDETGLAYDAFASLDPYEDSSVFDVGATVEHGKTPSLLREVFGLLEELRSRPVTGEELAKAKQRYRWDLRATLDDAESMCRHYGTHVLFDLEGHLDVLAQRALEVTPADLLEVACAAFDPRYLSITCVGKLARPTVGEAKRAIDAFPPYEYG